MRKTTLAVLVSMLFALTLPVLAFASDPGSAIVRATSVTDDFTSLGYKEPGDTEILPYWWVINNGDNPDPAALGQFYSEYGTQSRIWVVDGEFVRLQMDPSPTWSGGYVGTELSERQTLYAAELPGVWLPTPGHPVTLDVTMRYSPGFSPDGMGTQVGSAGLWFWNSPVAPTGQYPTKALGFNWASAPSGANFTGLGASVFGAGYNPYFERVRGLDMQAWNDWQIEWGANEDGTQYARFYINGVLVGSTTIAMPFPALSTTIWHDNQFQRGRSPFVLFQEIQSSQWIDIDYVKIEQH